MINDYLLRYALQLCSPHTTFSEQTTRTRDDKIKIPSCACVTSGEHYYNCLARRMLSHLCNFCLAREARKFHSFSLRWYRQPRVFEIFHLHLNLFLLFQAENSRVFLSLINLLLFTKYLRMFSVQNSERDRT
jgi:hypothetical protein